MEGFQWPEPTDEQLIALLRWPDTPPLQDMRDAIHLARRLDAGIDRKVAEVAWQRSFSHHGMGFYEWILTRGGTVEPLPSAVPTLAEALEAAQFLAGDSAGVVIRYLQAQQQEGQADD